METGNGIKKTNNAGYKLLSDVNSFDNRLARLTDFIKEKKDEYKKRGGKMFMGTPDDWYEDIRFCCPNGHVIEGFLKPEETGCVCLVCFQKTYIAPKGVTEEEFIKICIL